VTPKSSGGRLFSYMFRWRVYHHHQGERFHTWRELRRHWRNTVLFRAHIVEATPQELLSIAVYIQSASPSNWPSSRTLYCIQLDAEVNRSRGRCTGSGWPFCRVLVFCAGRTRIDLLSLWSVFCSPLACNLLSILEHVKVAVLFKCH
jgi:hypothetical protein